MKKIWYLLKCPEGNETDYLKKCSEIVNSTEMGEVICFQYQRMMRYGGEWHLENRTVLPGHIFLSGAKEMSLEKESNVSLTPCAPPRLKELCQNGTLIEISRGIMRNGVPIVTSGPLKGREQLIRRINRHKRTADIEIPCGDDTKKVTIGLEIYQKEI